MPLPYFLNLLTSLGKAPDAEVIQPLALTTANGSSRLPMLLPMNEALGRLLGYIASEGTVTSQSVIISNIDPEIIADIADAFAELGVSSYRIDRAIATADAPFVELACALGADGLARRKRVPGELFNATSEVMSAFLRAYFEGDGGPDGPSTITALSKSP